MKIAAKLSLLAFVLFFSLSSAGCGEFAGLGSAGKQLTLGYLQWDENVAVSNLTKIIMEEELGYESVELKLTDEVQDNFEGVADGELDAFQDVWLPNHDEYLEEVEGGVELLEPWYEGKTRFGIAVLGYMEDVRDIGDLKHSGTDKIIGIEPGALLHPQISRTVLPEYDLDMKLVESSTPTMLDEVEKANRYREPIAFLAWSPHWMNEEYDIRYLEDPKKAQGKFRYSSEITSIVREDLGANDPEAYNFLQAISLNEKEVNQMEVSIIKAGDPEEGVRNWLRGNRSVVEPWITAAQETRES